MSMTQPLWSPSPAAIEAAPLSGFMSEAARKSGRSFADFDSLHRWSIDDAEAFWSLVWDYCGVVGERGRSVLEQGEDMPGARCLKIVTISSTAATSAATSRKVMRVT